MGNKFMTNSRQFIFIKNVQMTCGSVLTKF